MYDTCIAFVIDECPDAVSHESLDVSRFWIRDHVLPGWRVMNSKDVLTRWWLGDSSQVESEKRPKKEIWWGLRTFGLKAARPGAKLKGCWGAHILLGSKRTTDWQADVRDLSAIEVTPFECGVNGVHSKWASAHRTRWRFWTMFTYGFLFAWKSFSWHL